MTPSATLDARTNAASAKAANHNGGHRPRLAIVDVDDIYMDNYQRPANERWLRERDGQFDLAMLGTVVLSARAKGKKHFAAIDGQHRIELCKRHGEAQVAAVVFDDLSKQEEAALFSRFQRERRNITPFQRFNADLIAGDEKAKAVNKIVSDEGFYIGESEGAGSIKAVVAVEKIYAEDPSTLRQVLRLSREAWGDMPFAQNERMLKGLHTFLKNVPDVDEQRFIERLRDVTPSTISGRAHNLREARGMNGALPRFIAEAIEDAYRSRRRSR